MLKITRRAVLAGSTALVSSAALARPSKKAFSGAAAIDLAVNESLAKNAVPGVSVAVSRNGVSLLERGYGVANLETGTPVTPTTVFRIGSLTKQFVAAAAIRLSMLGKLDLKAPVSERLSAFKTLKPFSALELMHHTSGLHSDEGGDPGSLAARSQVELANEIAGQKQPFDFDPGSAWLYSNSNYIVLGALIEQVTGRPLAVSMEEIVFKPLGLTELAFDSAADLVRGRASGYNATGEAQPAFVNAPLIEPALAGGAGAMRGTAGSLVKWHQALLGGKLLDTAHSDLMLAPGRLRDGRPASANRFSPDDAHYGDTEYACGLLVSGPSDPHPSILHYGVIEGFCAVLQTYPKEGVTFAALCNGFIGPNVPFRGIRKAVVATLG